MKKQKRLKDNEADLLGLDLKPKDSENRLARYTISDEEFQRVKVLREIKSTKFKEVKRTFDKSGNIISKVHKRESKELIDVPDNHQIKRVSTNVSTGQQWVITEPKKIEKQVEDFDFEGIIQKHIKPIEVLEYPKVFGNDFDMLTYTDVHIGMDTNPDNNAMYAEKWNKDVIIESADFMIKTTLQHKESNVLIIDDLADLMDGLDAQTTRGGHPLPQNMTNEEAFDCALEFKMKQADGFVGHYDRIVFNNVCNDNHAGFFGYFVNKSFKDIINIKYPQIEVNNYRQFISHYFIEDICFIITHGKDDKALKFGFKPVLDTKGIEKIDQYCKRNGIYKTAKRIIFKKGDSHQCLFDMCTSDDFDYYNYPALSPSSQWVQTNFKKGRRGFVLEGFKGLQSTLKPIFI